MPHNDAHRSHSCAPAAPSSSSPFGSCGNETSGLGCEMAWVWAWVRARNESKSESEYYSYSEDVPNPCGDVVNGTAFGWEAPAAALERLNDFIARQLEHDDAYHLTRVGVGFRVGVWVRLGLGEELAEPISFSALTLTTRSIPGFFVRVRRKIRVCWSAGSGYS